MDGPWTLDELVAEVAAALAEAGVDQGSSRVRDVPDRRTVRYYTSLGLLDGPTAFRGKVGLYGERQRLQLLAVKSLQAQGEPLSAIQARLLGLSTSRLRALAQARHAPEGPQPEAAPRPAEAAALLQGLPVHDSVTVLLKSKRPLTPEDLQAVEAASAPLLRLLRARHLID
jgi:DNA-binding transcriptional MerR regulator